MHNNIMAAGSKDRPPMLGPGRYSQWHSRFLRYLDTKSNGEYLRKCIFEGPYMPTNVLIAAVEAAENILPVAAHEEAETIHNMTAENKLYFQAEKEAIFLILTGIGDEIYSTVDACNTSKEMWTAIERLQQGESLNVQDVKTNLFWEFGKFTSRDGESMESYYSRFYKLMNELTRNNLQVSPMQVNVQFLQQLQPEWSRFVTIVKQRQEIDKVSYHKLFDVLKQFQNEVNDIRSERLARILQESCTNLPQQPSELLQTPGTRLRYHTKYNNDKSVRAVWESKDDDSLLGQGKQKAEAKAGTDYACHKEKMIDESHYTTAKIQEVSPEEAVQSTGQATGTDKRAKQYSSEVSKESEVENHNRISSISNKTQSLTSSNDSLNSRTSNVNAVCAKCGTCVFNSNHDACVSRYLKDVNATTKKPHDSALLELVNPREKRTNLLQTPQKKTVASDTIIQKSKSFLYGGLYEIKSEWKWWIAKRCPSVIHGHKSR
ncbi:hypothetical protein Tco_0488127 [Tanacetum coccineum]